MDWVEIGTRIRSQREAFGYTREAFAEMLDITPKFCADIELGKKGMSVPTLCRIASVLKLSTDYILFGEGPDRGGLSGQAHGQLRHANYCKASRAENVQELKRPRRRLETR